MIKLYEILKNNRIFSRIIDKDNNFNPNAPVDFIKQKIAPLKLVVSPQAKRRINIIIPTIDFTYFFGGYIAKFNFAMQLVNNGYKVRMVIVDYCNYDLPTWKGEIKHYTGLDNFFDKVEVFYSFDRSHTLEVSQNDIFIATTWWTAHIANDALKYTNAKRFLYFIQEYEPFTFPLGTFYALAQQTYSFPHYAIISTELLRDYFRQNKIGVFAGADPSEGEYNSISFENATLSFDIKEQEMSTRKKKSVLFYARPEQHASRNMFELGILALSNAIKNGCFDLKCWEFFGIGTVSGYKNIKLYENTEMKLLPRVSLSEYEDFLPKFDLGIALMLTPHPSLLPIEMASAGMIVLTNSFANKTEEKLQEISPNIIVGDPTIDGIEKTLFKAVEYISNYKQRIEGSHVKWSSDWSESFNADVMLKIKEFISRVS